MVSIFVLPTEDMKGRRAGYFYEALVEIIEYVEGRKSFRGIP